MPDGQEKSKPEKNLLSGLMDQIAGIGEGKKPSSFPVMMVLVGIVVLVVSLMGIRMALAKRKAAKLAFKIRKAEEAKAQAEENEKLAENANARAAARSEMKTLQREILSLKAKMVKRTVEHQKEVDQLRAVTSWDDIEVIDARE
jgi:septal ring-binding cell division protein DamX